MSGDAKRMAPEKNDYKPLRLRRQQVGKFVLWTGITANVFVCSWSLADGVKMNSPVNVEFLSIDIQPWLKITLTFKRKMVFMQLSYSML